MNASPRAPFWIQLARALAIFLAAFTLLNMLGEIRARRFDANEWWIDFRPVGRNGAILLIVASATLLAWATGLLDRWRRGWVVFLTRLPVALLLAVVAANGVVYYRLLFRGVIHSTFPVPLSLFIVAALVLILVAMRQPLVRPGGWFAVAVLFGICCVLFPISQMLCFGKTDYRRPADAIVVFGAKAYADGTPSTALADRVRTACELYRVNYAPLLVFSGGPGDGAVHEVEAMREFAIARGVPRAAILLDYHGLNTDLTVHNTATLFAQRGITSALAVSHYWHLPRVKMTYRRAGVELYTVPAREQYPLAQWHRMLVREVAALWAYYLRPLYRGE